MNRVMRWIGCVGLIACGCEGDPLSVGDLRCQGDGVQCEAPKGLEGDEEIVEPERMAEAEAVLTWKADLPCQEKTCSPKRAPQLLVHEDGSVTMAMARTRLRPGPYRDAHRSPRLAVRQRLPRPCRHLRRPL